MSLLESLISTTKLWLFCIIVMAIVFNILIALAYLIAWLYIGGLLVWVAGISFLAMLGFDYWS